MIRQALPTDAKAIVAIYNHYISHTVITFETEPLDELQMQQRLSDCTAANLPWLVEELDGIVTGYAYASKWKAREAYRHSVEITVYLHPEATGKGSGARLYAQLLVQLKDLSVHAVMGGIALPNPASVALHEKFGMRKVAHFEQVGFKFGEWVDVGYWQCIL